MRAIAPSRGRLTACAAQAASVACLLATACGNSSGSSWEIGGRHLTNGLLSVWGTSPTDVYVVGGTDDTHASLAEHYDGHQWKVLDTQQMGILWWVFGFAGGPIFMGGDGGMILDYAPSTDTFTKMPTPAQDTVFGLWGTSPTDMWAVGGQLAGGGNGFAWNLVGSAWVVAPGFPPTGITASDTVWKINGRSANDVWMVGTAGKAVHWDGSALTETQTPAGNDLFTVYGDAERYVAVGGVGTGIILENTGSGWTDDASPAGAPPFVGVCLSPSGDYVVGQESPQGGPVYKRGTSAWSSVDTGVLLENDEGLHSVWVDPSGGVWTVGGSNMTVPLSDGILLHQGTALSGALQ